LIRISDKNYDSFLSALSGKELTSYYSFFRSVFNDLFVNKSGAGSRLSDPAPVMIA